jgi:hypothetical protein
MYLPGLNLTERLGTSKKAWGSVCYGHNHLDDMVHMEGTYWLAIQHGRSISREVFCAFQERIHTGYSQSEEFTHPRYGIMA